jgi:hypothetical protein
LWRWSCCSAMYTACRRATFSGSIRQSNIQNPGHKTRVREDISQIFPADNIYTVKER